MHVLKEIFTSSNYHFTIYSVPTLIGCLYFFSLGFFVFLKNPKSRMHLLFFLVSLASSVWQLGATMIFASKTLGTAMFWRNVIGTGVVFIPTFAFLFAETFIDKKLKIINTLAVCGSLVFLSMCYFSNTVLDVPRLNFYGYYLVAGKYHPLFLSFFVPLVGTAIVFFFINYRKCAASGDKLKSIQSKYFFYSLLIYAGACVDFVPMYTKISFYPFGDVFVVSFITIVAFTIIRYRLFEIETVIHRTLLWVITIAIVVFPAGSLIYFAVEGIKHVFPVFLTILLFSILLLLFSFYYYHLRPLIDHIFRRRKYDYLQILGTLSQQISGIVDLDELTRKTLSGIKEVLYPKTIVLFLRDDKKHGYYLKSCFIGDSYKSSLRETSASFIPDGHSAIDVLIETEHPIERDLLDVDPVYKKVREDAEQLFDYTDGQLLFGLFMEKELVGLLFLGKRENLQSYTRLDINALHDLSLNIATSFYTSLHHQDILEGQRLLQEVSLARNIQENLLPQKAPRIPGISLYGLYSPSKEIGGDYYDFITVLDDTSTLSVQEHDANKIFVAVGDVSGKGMDAGMVVSSVKSYLAALIRYNNYPLKKILNILNQELMVAIKQQKFLSLLLLQYVQNQNQILYSSAGHEHILIYRAPPSDQVEKIKSGGVVLGMSNEISPFLEEHTLTLNKGDKILLYTDGATEARNPREDFFGLERLMESFKKNAHFPIKETLINIHNEIKEFMSTRAPYDDITLVGIEKD